MEAMLDEIRATFDCGIWYPVISSVLMIPDACGAIEHWGKGKNSRDRYVTWYDRWVYPRFHAEFVVFDGSVVYIVRNAMIHESTGFTRGRHGFDRILFLPPDGRGNVFEFNLMANKPETDDIAFQITILGLMNAVEAGVRDWLHEVRNDSDQRRNLALDKLVQYRPNGLLPYFTGFPTIS